MNSNKLSLFIITYNRSKLLKRTLEYLANSLLKNYPITVLNNASTDDTSNVVSEFVAFFPKLTLVNNKINIGPNANFLKAFDYSESEYTWILCDDDIFDLTKFDDVLVAIESGEADLIHVGAHRQDIWRMGGEYSTPKQLLKANYAYFKFASFMPCNVFRTRLFIKEYLVKGYNNIGNAYPHMPFAFGVYQNDLIVYVAKNQLVFAQEGQSYVIKDWFIWWMRTCELLRLPSEIRLAYLNQWKDNGVISDEVGFKMLFYARQLTVDDIYIRSFINNYFSISDKIKMFFYNCSISDLRHRFYWFRLRLKRRFLVDKFLL